MEKYQKIDNNNNKTDNISYYEKNINNKNEVNSEETQFYLITLEDNNGEHQQIRIFKNSDPSEIAFNFCKENNLDFKSMKYIKKNIQKIIEKFDEPNHKLFFLDNSYSSIQEVDEENLGSENTMKSKNSIFINDTNKEKEKNNNTNNINNINCYVLNENKDNKNNIKQNVNEKKNSFENYNKKETDNDIKLDKINDNNIDKINHNNNNSDNINNNKINSNIINQNNKKITEYKDNCKFNSNNKDLIKNKNINYNNINSNIDIINIVASKDIKNNKSSINANGNNQDNNSNNNIFNKNEKNNNYNNDKLFIENLNKITYIEEKIKYKYSSKDNNKNNNEIQNDKKIDNNNNKKNNVIKPNLQIKKDFISNIINNNYLSEKTIPSNITTNYKKKFQNLIPKLFKYINPKQHLINEEYKILKNKVLNNNNKENILDKYLKRNQMKKHSKNNSIKTENDNQEKKKDNDNNKEKLKTSKVCMTISNSHFNIKKEKKNINETSITNKKKNISAIDTIKCVKKNNKSLSNIAKNFPYQDMLSKKTKDKSNINKDKDSNVFLKLRKSSNPNICINQRNNTNTKFKKILHTQSEALDSILPNTLNNNAKINNNHFHQSINLNIMQEKNMVQTQNKSTKNKVIIKRNKKNLFDNKEHAKLSCDMNKNEIYQNNFTENTLRTFEGESGSKSKRITEMRNGLNKIFNNFLGQKNNILNTNYIINKRCRIINNKNKKNMSMNLSRYFLNYNKKNNKSPNYNIEINVSNNNIDNINLKENITNPTHKIANNKINNIILNNKNNNINKKNHYIIFNSQNQSILRRYNTNIKCSRILNSVSSYSKKRKKIIDSKNDKNNSKNNSSLKKRKTFPNKYKEINNSNISNSLIINDKTNPINDYSLKILDQYYTINNTINITNNNSMLNNCPNSSLSNKKNYKNNYKISNVKDFIKYLFKCLDKDSNGFIILNYKQKIKDIFNKNNCIINKEFMCVFQKMVKLLYEIYRKNSNIDFDENKMIITENLFIKYMIYIYNNKLNINEKKIVLYTKNEINKMIKIDFMPYKYKPKSSFNKLKISRNNLSSYNSSSRLNHTREYKSISNDINKYFLNKMRKNASRKKSIFNSFNDL